MLRPLAFGKAVTLGVDYPGLPRRRRTPSPRLFLVPTILLGDLSDSHILASLESHGCELIDKRKVDYFSFVRLGLGAKLSKAIAEVLRSIFSGDDHG